MTQNTTKQFIREKKWKVLDWPSQSPAKTQLSMHFTFRRLKGKKHLNKQKVKEAAVKASQKKNATVWR